MTDTPDVLPEMQAEARGYARGVREAAERVWRREWKTKCSCDHVLVKKKLDILALIPADEPAPHITVKQAAEVLLKSMTKAGNTARPSLRFGVR